MCLAGAAHVISFFVFPREVACQIWSRRVLKHGSSLFHGKVKLRVLWGQLPRQGNSEKGRSFGFSVSPPPAAAFRISAFANCGAIPWKLQNVFSLHVKLYCCTSPRMVRIKRAPLYTERIGLCHKSADRRGCRVGIAGLRQPPPPIRHRLWRRKKKQSSGLFSEDLAQIDRFL